MNMSTEIRVKTERQYKSIYTELKNFAFGDMHEIFFLCTCLGYKKRDKRNIKNSDDRFWSKTITPEEYSCYYAMIIQDNNGAFSSIEDDKIVLAEIEKYANAGIEILINEVLEDYLIKIDGEYRVDKQGSKELPKAIMHYIYENIEGIF